ncbi:MAG: hypothetical protein JWQ35_1842 [Bacteriovoracaceae bacterium]|nr:hypothetical protein [Bacteriovoracaceae bacterium]
MHSTAWGINFLMIGLFLNAELNAATGIGKAPVLVIDSSGFNFQLESDIDLHLEIANPLQYDQKMTTGQIQDFRLRIRSGENASVSSEQTLGLEDIASISRPSDRFISQENIPTLEIKFKPSTSDQFIPLDRIMIHPTLKEFKFVRSNVKSQILGDSTGKFQMIEFPGSDLYERVKFSRTILDAFNRRISTEFFLKGPRRKVFDQAHLSGFRIRVEHVESNGRIVSRQELNATDIWRTYKIVDPHSSEKQIDVFMKRPSKEKYQPIDAIFIRPDAGSSTIRVRDPKIIGIRPTKNSLEVLENGPYCNLALHTMGLLDH